MSCREEYHSLVHRCHYPAVQQRAQGVMGGTQNTECSALFPCAPNGSKTRTPGSETYAKKVQFRVRNDHWIKAPKMTFNRVNPRHYKLQLEEELFTTMAILLLLLLLFCCCYLWIFSFKLRVTPIHHFRIVHNAPCQQPKHIAYFTTRCIMGNVKMM